MAFSILTSPEKISAVRNPVWLHVQAAANWAKFTDYRIRVAVQAEPSYRAGLYNTVATVEGQPDQNGEVFFNLAPILASLVAPESPQSAGATSLRRLTAMNQRYKLVVDEVINSVPAPSSTQSVTDLHAIYAGFPETEGALMQYWAVSDKRFLTRAPREGKRVDPLQPEFLTAACMAAASGAVKIYVRVQFENQTWSAATDTGLGISFTLGDTVMIPAGFEQLNLSAMATLQNIRAWEVWLVLSATGAEVTERMRYTLDPCAFYPHTRYYFFVNPLGGIDTLRTTGNLSARPNYVSNTVQVRSARPPRLILGQPAAFGVAVQPPGMLRRNVNRTESVQQAIGHLLTWAERDWMAGLLGAEAAWRVGDERPNLNATGQLVPIILEDAGMMRYQDESMLEPAQFSYKEAYLHSA
jgi:hypothetical protein